MLSGLEAKELASWQAAGTSAASWSDWALFTLGDMDQYVREDKRRRFQELGLSLARVIEFFVDLCSTTWAALELKRRDAAFTHIAGKSARQQIPSLRGAPLFSPELVPSDFVQKALEDREKSQKEDILYSRAEPPRKKQRTNFNKPFPSFKRDSSKGRPSSQPAQNAPHSSRDNPGPSNRQAGQDNRRGRGDFKKNKKNSKRGKPSRR